VRAQYNIGPKVSYEIFGRTRIADGLTDTTLSEVKNVRYQAYTQQLKDAVAYAQQNELQFDLYVRPNGGTVLSGPLQDAIYGPDPAINLKFIP